jgi:D-aminopeptidase
VTDSQLNAAHRATPAGTPAPGSHSSGDLFLAASTANPGGFSRYGDRGGRPYDQLSFVPWDAIDPFFTAVVQGTEEAVANALCAGEEMTGYRGHRVPGLPRDRVTAAFQED